MFRAKQHSFHTLIVNIAALLAWFPTQNAAACSGCDKAFVVPRAGDLPENLVAFRYMKSYCPSSDGGVSTPRLYRLDGQVRIEVPLRTESAEDDRPFPFTSIGKVWLVPQQSLAAGTQLVLETPTNLAEPVPQIREYQVTAPAPLPTELGTLRASVQRDTLQVSDTRGGCTRETHAAYADLTVELAPAARPYAALFEYLMFVDGNPHPAFKSNILSSSPSLPQGQDRIYTSCTDPKRDESSEPFRALEPGLHRVRFNAHLRGISLDTPEIEVELTCPATKPDAAVPPVAELVDGGAPGGSIATDTSPSTRTSADDGCQLYAVGHGRRAFPLWALAPSIALFWRRRRGHSRLR